MRRQNEHTPNEENKTTVPFIVGCHMEKVGCMSDDAFVSVSGMLVEQIPRVRTHQSHGRVLQQAGWF